MRQKELCTYSKQDHHYIIYNRNIKRPLAIFKMVNTTEDIITLHLVDGKLMKPKSKKQAKLEFRLLKGTRLIMVHLYDYIPRLFWPIYYFSCNRFKDSYEVLKLIVELSIIKVAFNQVRRLNILNNILGDSLCKYY